MVSAEGVDAEAHVRMIPVIPRRAAMIEMDVRDNDADIIQETGIAESCSRCRGRTYSLRQPVVSRPASTIRRSVYESETIRTIPNRSPTVATAWSFHAVSRIESTHRLRCSDSPDGGNSGDPG